MTPSVDTFNTPEPIPGIPEENLRYGEEEEGQEEEALGPECRPRDARDARSDLLRFFLPFPFLIGCEDVRPPQGLRDPRRAEPFCDADCGF